MYMSILDQIKELEEQKNRLLEQARKEAVEKAEVAIAELNALGFNYRLVGGPSASSGKRRAGVRQQVLKSVQDSPRGLSRADVLEKLGAKGDKSAEQSVSNALAALKKNKSISATNGIYRAVT